MTPSLEKHSKATYEEKLRRVQEAIFMKTWCILTGEATTVEPLDGIDSAQVLRRRVAHITNCHTCC
jgi:hypothetical protein